MSLLMYLFLDWLLLGTFAYTGIPSGPISLLYWFSI